ncbi:MAG: type II toxin-antitoxin system RelE/ParE family toxin [Hyphomicrobium sp.]
MRVYKLKAFARFQRREGLTDAAMAQAVCRLEQGLIDAELGGGLVKQRVARPGQGKSGGWRTIIAYRRGERAVFLFGFSKSDRENIADDEVVGWQRVARLYFALVADELGEAIAARELIEVYYGNDDQDQN